MGRRTVKARRRKIGKFNYKAKPKLKNQESFINDSIIKKEETQEDVWNRKKTVKFNCEKLGILYDLNTAMKPATLKDEAIKENVEKRKPKKETAFVKRLIDDSQRRKGSSNLRMPPRSAEFVAHLLDKYGEDYKAMTLDARNYDQDTWKQLRNKVNRFKCCTDQYAQYLKKRSLLPV